MPVAEAELHFENPFQLLVAVMLSAQCTDKRVNMVTPELFRRYPTPKDLGEAKLSDVEGKGMCKSEEYVHYLKRCIDWRMEHETNVVR